MSERERVLEVALQQIACPHTREGGTTAIAGGNDYLMCWRCGLEWDYGKRLQPSAVEIARLALDHGLNFTVNAPG